MLAGGVAVVEGGKAARVAPLLSAEGALEAVLARSRENFAEASEAKESEEVGEQEKTGTGSALLKDFAAAPRVEWAKGGGMAARKKLAVFLRNGLVGYATKRHDAVVRTTSFLSPYLHFGMVSPIPLVIAVRRHKNASAVDIAKFVDELVVRRELAVNFAWFSGGLNF